MPENPRAGHSFGNEKRRTSGLDYHRMLEVSNMIRELNKENKVVIIVSHDFEFLSRTCDKIFDMKGGHAERR